MISTIHLASQHRFYTSTHERNVSHAKLNTSCYPKRVILVDFDGVISKSTEANEFIAKRIHTYMKHVTGIKESSVVDTMNMRLYTTYGHTVIGLQQEGYTVDIKNFNNFVYGDIHKTDLTLSVSEVLDLCSFMMRCRTLNFDIMLFSNAHQNWLTHFIAWDPVLYGIQDSIVEPYGVLKPMKISYDLVDTFLRERNYQDIFFVDDKESNVCVSPNTWNKLVFEQATMKVKDIPVLFNRTT